MSGFDRERLESLCRLFNEAAAEFRFLDCTATMPIAGFDGWPDLVDEEGERQKGLIAEWTTICGRQLGEVSAPLTNYWLAFNDVWWEVGIFANEANEPCEDGQLKKQYDRHWTAVERFRELSQTAVRESALPWSPRDSAAYPSNDDTSKWLIQLFRFPVRKRFFCKTFEGNRTLVCCELGNLFWKSSELISLLSGSVTRQFWKQIVHEQDLISDALLADYVNSDLCGRLNAWRIGEVSGNIPIGQTAIVSNSPFRMQSNERLVDRLYRLAQAEIAGLPSANFYLPKIEAAYKAHAVVIEEAGNCWRVGLGPDDLRCEQATTARLDLYQSLHAIEVALGMVAELTVQNSSPMNGENPGTADDLKATPYVFCPTGDGYFISGFGESGTLSAKTCKGLRQLHRIIKAGEPGELMVALVGRGNTSDIRNGADAHSRQPIADDVMLAEIRAKLQTAMAEQDKATRSGDTVEIELCREEIDKWKDEFKRVTGLGGKPRDLNSIANKLRPTITATLKRAYAAMRNATPPMAILAEHFELSVKSEGQTFVYHSPQPGISWETEFVAPGATK